MFEGDLVVANQLPMPQANVRIAGFFHQGFRTNFEMPIGMPTVYPAFMQDPNWDRNTQGPLAGVSSRLPWPIGERLLEDRLIRLLRGAADLESIRRTQMLINIVRLVDLGMDYHTFYVRVLDQHVSEGGAVGFTPNTVDGVAVNACFVQEQALTGQTIAHECSHFLTSPIPGFLDRDGHSSKRGHLLIRTPGPDDIKIPNEQVNFMNRSGVA